MKRQIAVLIGIVSLSPILWQARLQAQQPISLRLGHVGFPGSLFAITADEFAKRVNTSLQGKVEVKVFHSSQLGSDEQMSRGIKVGAPEMFVPSTVMSTLEQKYGVFEMPYIIVSRAHMKKVAENKQVQKQLFDELPAKGDESPRGLGKWLSPHHQQCPADCQT